VYAALGCGLTYPPGLPGCRLMDYSDGALLPLAEPLFEVILVIYLGNFRSRVCSQ
jgi:hypothetical protein